MNKQTTRVIRSALSMVKKEDSSTPHPHPTSHLQHRGCIQMIYFFVVSLPLLRAITFLVWEQSGLEQQLLTSIQLYECEYLVFLVDVPKKACLSPSAIPLARRQGSIIAMARKKNTGWRRQRARGKVKGGRSNTKKKNMASPSMSWVREREGFSLLVLKRELLGSMAPSEVYLTRLWFVFLVCSLRTTGHRRSKFLACIVDNRQ